jgi:hypothetical protein
MPVYRKVCCQLVIHLLWSLYHSPLLEKCVRVKRIHTQGYSHLNTQRHDPHEQVATYQSPPLESSLVWLLTSTNWNPSFSKQKPFGRQEI